MALAAQLARSARRASSWGPLCCALAVAGCNGEIFNLGSSPLQAGGAGAGGGTGGVTTGPHDVWGVQSAPIIEQVEDLLLANPTLTAAMDELYYSQQERGAEPEPHPTSIRRRVADGAGW